MGLDDLEFSASARALACQGIFSNKLENTCVFVKATDVASGLLPHVIIALYMVSVRVLCPT